MKNFAIEIILGASAIVLVVNAQFKMAEHGKPCLDYSPFEPMKVCEHEKGLDCVGTSSKLGRVCACYGTFVFDKTVGECRRKVGDACIPYSKKQEEKRSWNEKCQSDGECSGKGLCVCKKGLVKAVYGHSCVGPSYIRGGRGRW